MMQAFYWDCPKVDNKEFAWWNYVREKIPSLAEAGFLSLFGNMRASSFTNENIYQL